MVQGVRRDAPNGAASEKSKPRASVGFITQKERFQIFYLEPRVFFFRAPGRLRGVGPLPCNEAA